VDKILGKKEELVKLVEYQKDAIVSKEIIKKEKGTVTLFAFDKGQGLSEHTAPFDALVYLLDGSAQVTIDEKPRILTAGEMIIMPAHIRHALNALEPFKMLLIMIRQ
jgi:quercetin dioxygenase-like cupin family protein